MDDLFNFFERYCVLLAVLMVALISSIFTIRLILKNISEKKEVTRSISSYIFLWPLLLTRKEGDKYVQRGFTRREWIGLLILALIMVLAILFTPTVKR